MKTMTPSNLLMDYIEFSWSMIFFRAKENRIHPVYT